MRVTLWLNPTGTYSARQNGHSVTKTNLDFLNEVKRSFSLNQSINVTIASNIRGEKAVKTERKFKNLN